ncbi:MAG TPA: hypothetical protein VHO03_20695 [Ignavibacteriales bacterium]|nr:hypothetical protein [Ignavibacteriales bacterium]
MGVDSETAHLGPAEKQSGKMKGEFDEELKKVAPKTNPKGDDWHPGDAQGQAMMWEVQALAKAGTLGIIGVYPETVQFFPLGMAMNKNLTLNMGNCNHRKYIPRLLEMVQSEEIDPGRIITKQESLIDVLDAYKEFDKRSPGWLKVELKMKRQRE